MALTHSASFIIDIDRFAVTPVRFLAFGAFVFVFEVDFVGVIDSYIERRKAFHGLFRPQFPFRAMYAAGILIEEGDCCMTHFVNQRVT